jgi:anti-sigma factor RsiW
MTARDVILKIESLPQDERTQVEAWLRARDAAREDAIDLALIEARKNEPARDFRTVLSELGIQSE